MKLKVTVEINEYSNPTKSLIRVHNHWNDGNMVELEVNGERYSVKGDDLKSAVSRCMQDNEYEWM